ncbi:MAG TPA: sigma-70 family RNA polymerase sigma factor [Phycisphaerae bacterium]|nr:sigma-70 family RNA polymerase sigma factor [Phycisphaerae bacterium]
MTLSEADRFLLEGIRRGEAEAWSQLVERYRGRLFAFAQSRLRSAPDAEDVLQETFLTFLKALPRYRGEAGIETFLFTLLRRRLVDWFRGRRLSVCLLHDVIRPVDGDEAGEPIAQVAAPDPSASVYARRDEHDELRREALAEGIRALVNGYKKQLKFRELKIVEMLFYCQLANKEVGKVSGVNEKQIALIKHRSLHRIRDKVAAELRPRGLTRLGEEDPVHSEAMLTEVWESLRLSCPKRSTIGAYHLGTLEEAWQDYVDFHLKQLGCRFCLANLADLKQQDSRKSEALQERIMQSTVGFLRQSYLEGPRGRA